MTQTSFATIPWEHPTVVVEHRNSPPQVLPAHPGLGYRVPGSLHDAAPTISIFAREYVRVGNEDKPRLVFFQGGPGFAGAQARRPIRAGSPAS